jgi:hypothetical protein
MSLPADVMDELELEFQLTNTTDKVGQDSRYLNRNLKLDVQKIKRLSVRFVNAGRPLFRR